MVLGIAILPFNSLNAEKSHQYKTVVTTNTLTVVAVENPTTVFKDGQFLHGFGYDLARNYAQSLNVKLDFKTVPDNATPAKAFGLSPVKNKKKNGIKAIIFQARYHQKVRICQVK